MAITMQPQTCLHAAQAQPFRDGYVAEDVKRSPKYKSKLARRASRRRTNALESNLLQLPQELRDDIIRLDMPSSIQVDPYAVAAATEPSKLLQVCSQLRLDAAEIYYGTPIYLPWCKPENFRKWTDSIPTDYRQFVKGVHVDRFFSTPEAAMEFAQQFDSIGGFKPGTVFASTSIGPLGDATSVWINARDKTKLYEDVLPLSAAEHSALPEDEYGFNCWD